MGNGAETHGAATNRAVTDRPVTTRSAIGAAAADRASSPRTARRVRDHDPRRPAGVRGSQPRAVARTGIQLSHAPHPLTRTDENQASWRATALAGVFSALVVLALVGVAQWRTAQVAQPAGVVSVEVRQGETLSDVAERVAPDAPVAETVARIVDLNGMSSAGVAAGQTLLAPVAQEP